MGLRIILTDQNAQSFGAVVDDGDGVSGLTATFGAIIQNNVVQTAADASAALASANNAAASATSASASATSATNSASSATSSASSASASATAAANSATSASGSANGASTSATNAANSASAASGSASAANTSATNAANSATSASGSASAAATSATNASNSASAASTSQTNAANSATSANTSASNASSSATAASASASLAQAWASQASGVVNGTTYYSAYYYATQASSSASSASTSATSASNSASSASTSASNASTSATNAANSATSAANSAASIPATLSNRNRVINGDFRIWQRGTSANSSSGVTYLADRWKMQYSGSSVAFSQQAFTLGQTDVPGEPRFFYRSTVTSVAGSGNFVNVNQVIEGVRTLAGQNAMLTFYAKADSAKNIAFDASQAFGGGGSPSAAVSGIGKATCALTTLWQKFTIPITFPSIAGKTLGTDGTDGVWLTFWLDAGSNFNTRTGSLGQQSGTFDISRVQLEPGTVATPFEDRHFETELNLCQRYYEVVQLNDNIYAPSTANMNKSYGYATAKRANPTLDTTGLTLGSCTLAATAAYSNALAITVTPGAAGVLFLGGTISANAEL